MDPGPCGATMYLDLVLLPSCPCPNTVMCVPPDLTAPRWHALDAERQLPCWTACSRVNAAASEPMSTVASTLLNATADSPVSATPLEE